MQHEAGSGEISRFARDAGHLRPRIGTVVLIFFFLLASASLHAQTAAAPQSKEFKFSSLTQERPPGEPDKVILTGNVEILYRGLKLSADRVDLDMKTKDVTAVGHVVLEFPAEVLSAESLTFNMDSDQGSLVKAVGLIQPTIRYESDALDRKADNLYSMSAGSFTSCAQPVPRWKFSFSRANLKKDDYVEMWGAVFSVKGLPIFYWPYMRYPLDQERATGFLIPLAGYSQTKGLRFSEAFYWAIARNMDATFSLDYYASKGVGGGLEYRYMFSDGTNGNARLYYFTFKSQAGLPTPDDAYIIRWNHSQSLPGGFSLVANVDYQSSFEFLREFDNNIQQALVFNKSSQVYLSKSWSTFNFSIRAAQFETGFPTLGVSLITRSLPQVNFDSFKMKLLGPLFLSFSSSFNRWQYGWDTQFTAGTQLKSQDFSLNPSISLPFNGIPWLTTNFSVESNFKYAWQSIKPGIGIVDTPVLTSNYALNMEFIGPVFYRIWDLGEAENNDNSNLKRLKHIIEPSITYRYESPTVNSDKIVTQYPLYRYHQLTYGLTNHFLLKTGAASPQEIFTLGLNQTYYLSPEDSPMKYYPINGVIPRFSELSSYVRFYPGDKYSFDFGSSYNTYFKTFTSIRLGANVGVPSDDLFLNVNWYKSTNPFYTGALYNRHQVSLSGGAKIAPLNLDARAEIDYNVSDKQMMYSAGSLVYHYQCLDFKVDARIYFFRDKPEYQIKFSLGLGNIGKTTDFLGGAGWD
jgi:lipopolysaccharide assembly outer membrane protein LptD (OstA)